MTLTIKNLQNRIRISPKKIRQAVLKVLSAEGAKKTFLINVCFVDDSRIRELNRAYLKKNSPTDVLAFDMSSPGEKNDQICADIVVSCETAARNARIFKTSPVYEAYLYLLHGVLHILGYCDDTPKGRRLMQYKVREVLSSCLSRKAKRSC